MAGTACQLGLTREAGNTAVYGDECSDERGGRDHAIGSDPLDELSGVGRRNGPWRGGCAWGENVGTASGNNDQSACCDGARARAESRGAESSNAHWVPSWMESDQTPTSAASPSRCREDHYGLYLQRAK